MCVCGVGVGVRMLHIMLCIMLHVLDHFATCKIIIFDAKNVADGRGAQEMCEYLR